jgi:hypothetical protein
MAGLRVTGRKVAKAAKAKAPIYSGSWNTKNVPYVDKRALVEKGNLRRSISNARRLDHVGDMFYLRVGPTSKGKGQVLYAGKGRTALGSVHRYGNDKRKAAVTSYKTAKGQVKHNTSSGQVRGPKLYRQKIADKTGFMAEGYREAQATLAKDYQEAVDKAYAKYK